MTGEDRSRRGFLAKSALTGGVLLAGVGSVSAVSTVFVDKNDPGAYDTISQAVYEAPDGATVQVSSGVYEETVAVPSDKSLTIRGDPGGDKRGAGPDAPILDGEGEPQRVGFFLESPAASKELVIEGVRIRNYGKNLDDGNVGAGVKNGGQNNVTIRDVSMVNIAGKGVDMTDAGGEVYENWTVRRSTFDSIARAGIYLSSIDGGEIRNNEVFASNAVPDDTDAWWERGQPSGNPSNAIKVSAAAGRGREAAARNVVVEDNEIHGQFDIAGVMVISSNYGGTGTIVEDIVVRGNSFDQNDTGEATVPSRNAGIWFTVVSSSEKTDFAAMRNLTIEGNTIANAEYGINGASKVQFFDGSASGGLRRVVCRDNEIQNCGRGFNFETTGTGEAADVTVNGNDVDADRGITVLPRQDGSVTGLDIVSNHVDAADAVYIAAATTGELSGLTIDDNTLETEIGIVIRGSRESRVDGVEVSNNDVTGINGLKLFTFGDGRIHDVTATNNRFAEFDLGVVPWAAGKEIDSVEIVDNEFVRNSDPAEDNIVYGVEPVAFGADLKNVRVSGSSFSKTRRGISAFALQESQTDVTVQDCSFTENRDGIGTFAFDEESTVELHGERLTFERNEVGVRTGRNASGDNLHVHSSDFRENTEFAAENRSEIGVIDATCNYWDDPNGPSHESNRNGRGDAVSDGVDYDPLLPQSYTTVSDNACRPSAGNPNEHAGGSGRSETATEPKLPGERPDHST